MIGACVCAAGLQSADQAHRRSFVSLGFIRLLWKPEGAETHSTDQHQRYSGVSAFWSELALLHFMFRARCNGEWRKPSSPGSWSRTHLSRGSLEKGGAKRTKTYRVYDWDQVAPK